MDIYLSTTHMAWRPELSDEIEQRVEKIIDSEGFQTKSEFVRYAVRRKLEELEDAGEEAQDALPAELEHLKHAALDKSKKRDEREEAIKTIAKFGDEAVPALAEIADTASGTMSRESDMSKKEHGAKLRKMARKRINRIVKD